MKKRRKRKIKELFSLSKIQLIWKVNTLQGQVDVLEDTIKDELYKEFMAKLGEPMEMKRLRDENKKLRLKNKALKDVIKEDK